MEDQLVSICVITYNSSQTIIETLESIYMQTYQNIELIISDDCSKDNTCEVISTWLKEKSKRFINTVLLQHEKNSGTAINLDYAIKEANGKWIKILAGDDLLFDTAIASFINMSSKTTSEFLVSNVQVFSTDQIDLDFYDCFYKKLTAKCQRTLKQKKRLILSQLFSAGPSWFFTKNLYLQVSNVSSKYSMCDEWPLLYSVLQSNHDIYAEDIKLVKYRISNNSLSHGTLPNKLLISQEYDFFKNIRLKEMLKHFMFLEVLDQFINYKILFLQFSYFEKYHAIKEYTLLKYLSPINIAKKVKSLLSL